MRRRFEVPTRRKGSDQFVHNHRRLRESERCHNLEVSFLGLHSCLEVDSSFEHQGWVLPWETDGLVGMLALNLPNWQTGVLPVVSWLQAHRRTVEIHTQGMPEESLGFVVAGVNIRQIGP